jgi:phospho-N-acetylmuramoyl-pentapeptide-transferase
LKKIFFWKDEVFFGLRLRHKLVIEVILASIISFWLFNDLKIDIINVPYFGVFYISWFYMIFSTFVIVSFANAVNITDGLDGLATGVLMIALFSFWFIAGAIFDSVMLTFLTAWIGGLIAFLYFNIYPARLFLGDTGALSFGATFAVIGLILGRPFALPLIGLFFVIEIMTSLLQLLSKKFLKRKIFPVAPFHLWLQMKGWEEPKIVMRVWIFSILFAVVGLMMAFLR